MSKSLEIINSLIDTFEKTKENEQSQRANYLISKSQHTQDNQYYKEAIQILHTLYAESGKPEYLYKIARTYYELGEYTSCVKHAQQYIKRYTNNEEAKKALSCIYSSIQKIESLEEYREDQQDLWLVAQHYEIQAKKYLNTESQMFYKIKLSVYLAKIFNESFKLSNPESNYNSAHIRTDLLTLVNSYNIMSKKNLAVKSQLHNKIKPLFFLYKLFTPTDSSFIDCALESISKYAKIQRAKFAITNHLAHHSKVINLFEEIILKELNNKQNIDFSKIDKLKYLYDYLKNSFTECKIIQKLCSIYSITSYKTINESLLENLNNVKIEIKVLNKILLLSNQYTNEIKDAVESQISLYYNDITPNLLHIIYNFAEINNFPEDEESYILGVSDVLEPQMS